MGRGRVELGVNSRPMGRRAAGLLLSCAAVVGLGWSGSRPAPGENGLSIKTKVIVPIVFKGSLVRNQKGLESPTSLRTDLLDPPNRSLHRPEHRWGTTRASGHLGARQPLEMGRWRPGFSRVCFRRLNGIGPASAARPALPHRPSHPTVRHTSRSSADSCAPDACGLSPGSRLR